MSAPRPADDVGGLPGVHAARRAALAKLGIRSVEDLLRLAPRRYEDRRNPASIASLEEGGAVAVVAKVMSSKSIRARRGLSILETVVADETGEITVRWFQKGFQRKPLPLGLWVALYGPVKRRGKALEITGPALERLPPPGEEPADGLPGVARLVPVHPLTTGLSAPAVRRAVWHALPAADEIEDAVPSAVRRAHGLVPIGEALRTLHFPDAMEDAEAARRRLAFDELLVHEILLARRRLGRRRKPGVRIEVDRRVDARIRARLPFQLTPGQEHVVADLVHDLAEPWPMQRLAQGDVGSGKTAVAAYALLAAVAAGWQGAFMAPTEVLARQHQRTLQTLLEGSRVRIETLFGGRRTRERREALARIEAGEVDIVIGTHAVISDAVAFKRLALVVVDEQHKFGVRQRHALVEKGLGPDGIHPHCLVMTATPIPRTLALTVYGDLDVSIIEGRPPGRESVETWVVTPREGKQVFERVKAELEKGRQAFVIYPLVEESDKLGLRDAIDGRERWARALPRHEVGLLHGKMKRPEREEAMDAFRSARAHVLVATVVIEVGVDIPNATVLVVEHAERFGLSQLHQLRGRIGRGEGGGLCVLVDRSTSARPARLDVLEATDDGFEIAEEDLRLRGIGDVMGTRQHGDPGLRAARPPRDLPVLERARRAARALLEEDPLLELPEHLPLSRLVQNRVDQAGGDMDGG
jgi:ATP-dependent DNA helicase RecG